MSLRFPSLTLALATAILLALPEGPATGGERGENIAAEQRLRLQAEWARARAVGGYPDPFTALGAALRGEPIPGALQPALEPPREDKIWDNFDMPDWWPDGRN